MAVKQDGTRRCKDCGQIAKYLESTTRCTACYKRLVWRPSNSAAVDRERAASRGLKETYRGACEDCGAPTNGCDGPGKASRFCRACWARRSAEREAQRAHERAEQTRALWALGLPAREIAQRLGMKPESFGVYCARLRHRGYDLPYRRHRPSVAA